MPQVPAVSNAQADRAANAFRAYMAASQVPPNERDQDQYMDVLLDAVNAIPTMASYRAMHAYPLQKVTVGVRQMIRTELGLDAPRPGQRFKRMDRIQNKLLRYPTMRLSQMEDIGGCRAVLESLDDLYAVEGRLRRRWPHARVTDHTDEPKDDGYRAIHIIERRDGRLIEVQLRTERQQAWAEIVELWSGRTPHNLKDGEGPADLRRYFAMAAERLARRDRGERRNRALDDEFARLREQVRHYFARPS